MDNSFVNKKDRIIASAIEIISEAGIESLTTKNLAMKENMSEALLYRYFGGIDEVLVEVIDTYTKFDEGIIATIAAKDVSHLERALIFMDTLGTYYNGYSAIAAIPLNYEYFLHDVNTRDKIDECVKRRMSFVKNELSAAMDDGEIRDIYTPDELTTIFFGTSNRDLLNRRIYNENVGHDKVARSIIEKIAASLKIKDDKKT